MHGEFNLCHSSCFFWHLILRVHNVDILNICIKEFEISFDKTAALNFKLSSILVFTSHMGGLLI